MKKIDVSKAPLYKGTNYPPPHDEIVRDREWRRLGDAAGLTQFGVNLVTLKPGVWSSQRHWHSHEDEFVYMLEGELVLTTDSGDEILRSGDCAGFPGGSRDGHCLKNLSDKVARFLVVGSRNPDDWGEYSDIDMKFLPSDGGYVRKTGEPIE